MLALASCTKLITAIAALRLVQQGRLDLDDSQVVEQHLPELCQQDIITSTPGAPLDCESRKHGITVRQLLTHTSGSGYDILNPLLQAWRKSRCERPMALTAALPDAIATPGLFQPGEGWSYGGGSDWTGLLISRLTNMSLGAYMRKEIFDVVGCDSRIGFSQHEVQQHGDMVQVVALGKDGSLTPHFVPEQKSERGGGGLFSSANNFIKILGDLISHEPKLLDAEMLDELFKAQLEEGSKALDQLRNSTPMFAAMTGPLTANVASDGINHALGGLLIAEDNGALGKTRGTMTWGGAFGCLWLVNREQGVAAFYGSCMFPPGEGKTSALMGSFVEEVWSRMSQ
jgi:CubicO group peptidase (beta-lactamase class C family)